MRLKLFLLSLAFCFMAAFSAHAADMTARQTAEAGADRIMALLNDPAFKNPATKADIRVTSRVPSRRVSTLLPIFTAIFVN